MIDYDDVQLVAAIADAQTIRRAQARTHVHIATLYRRLRDLERRCGGALFERSGSSLVPTVRAQPFLDAAGALADRLAEIERRVAAQDDRLVGPLHVTTADSLLPAMCRCLLDFRKDHPDIHIRLDVSNSHADLGRREADVAVRPTATPPPNLFGRKAASFNFGVFRASENAFPGWIGFGPEMAGVPAAAWHADQVRDEDINLRVNSFSSAAAAAAAGWGRALLPRYLAEEHGLKAVDFPSAAPTSEIWLLIHPDMKSSPRVRIFADFTAKWLKRRVSERPR